MLTKDLKKIKNSLQDFEGLTNKYNFSEMRDYFASKSGYLLGNYNIGRESPCTYGNIPDIRRIYASGLRILSNKDCQASNQTKFYADIVIKRCLKEGFRTYTREEVLLAYICCKY